MSLTLAGGDRVAVDQQRSPQRSYGRQFLVMFADALRAIAREIEHASSLRVFLALPDRLDFESWRQLDQGDLSRELKIDRSSVKRALDDLLRHGVIERQGHRALQVWRLSLNFGWRGNVESYHAARSKRGRNRGQAVEKPRPAMTVAEGILWKLRSLLV